MKKISIIIFILFSFLGCSEKIFFRVYDKSIDRSKIEKISLSSNNRDVEERVKEILNNYKIKIDNKSNYRVNIDFSFYRVCHLDYKNNAFGAEFNGYIRLSLYKNDKEIARVQQEIKDSVSDSSLKNLIEKILDR